MDRRELSSTGRLHGFLLLVVMQFIIVTGVARVLSLLVDVLKYYSLPASFTSLLIRVSNSLSASPLVRIA